MRRCVIRMNAEVFEVARIQKGLSLRQLATALGVSHGALSLWRAGKIGASPRNTKELAEVLGVPVNDLWEIRIMRPDGTLFPLPAIPAPPPPSPAPDVAPITFPGWDE